MLGESEAGRRRAVVAEGRAGDQGDHRAVIVLDRHDDVVADGAHPSLVTVVRRGLHPGVLEEVEAHGIRPPGADDDLEHAAVVPVQLGAEAATTHLLVLREVQLRAGGIEVLGQDVVVGDERGVRPGGVQLRARPVLEPLDPSRRGPHPWMVRPLGVRLGRRVGGDGRAVGEPRGRSGGPVPALECGHQGDDGRDGHGGPAGLPHASAAERAIAASDVVADVDGWRLDPLQQVVDLVHRAGPSSRCGASSARSRRTASAVWLLTVPGAMPSSAAVSSTESPHRCRSTTARRCPGASSVSAARRSSSESWSTSRAGWSKPSSPA